MSKINNLPNGLNIVESGIDSGNMDLRYGSSAETLQHQKKLFDTIGLNHNTVAIITPEGSNNYIDITSTKINGVMEPADAIILKGSKRGIALFPADCVPLVIYHQKLQLLALVHLGWKGSILNLQNDVIKYLISNYKIRSKDLFCYLGPSIKQASYILPSIHPRQELADWSQFIHKKDNQYAIDLPEYIVDQLISLGVLEDNIVVSTLDTADSQNRLYSNYRQRHQGTESARNGFIVSING